jgi:hypothetical protein
MAAKTGIRRNKNYFALSAHFCGYFSFLWPHVVKASDAFLFGIGFAEPGVISFFTGVHASPGLLDRAALAALFSLPMRADGIAGTCSKILFWHSNTSVHNEVISGRNDKR